MPSQTAVVLFLFTVLCAAPALYAAGDGQDEMDGVAVPLIGGKIELLGVLKKQKRPIFLKFAAPGCSYCRALSPKWKELAQKANESGSKALVAEVDCSKRKGKEVCDQYKVTNYPQMKMVYVQSNPVAVKSIAYTGGRSTEEMFAWMSEVEKNPEAYRQPTTGKPESSEQQDSAPTSNEEEESVADAEFAVAGIGTKANLLGVVKKRPVFLKFAAPGCSFCRKMQPAWQALAQQAQENNRTALVAEVDCSTVKGKEVCDQFGVNTYPQMKMVYQKSNPVAVASVAYTGGRMLAEMLAWMTEVEGNPVGAEYECTKSVKVLSVHTASTLHKMLQDGPAFVKFFAPWCGHCKKLAPTWEELSAKAAQAQVAIQVAEVDCTAGDNKELCGLFSVKSFPQMKLLQADGEDSVGVVPYQGGRALQEMFDFMVSFHSKAVPAKATVKLVNGAGKEDL